MAGLLWRSALARSIGWWYLKRLVRRRGAAAAAAFVAEKGLSLAGRRRKRRSVLWLLLVGVLAGAGVYRWRRMQPEPVAT